MNNNIIVCSIAKEFQCENSSVILKIYIYGLPRITKSQDVAVQSLSYQNLCTKTLGSQAQPLPPPPQYPTSERWLFLNGEEEYYYRTTSEHNLCSVHSASDFHINTSRLPCLVTARDMLTIHSPTRSSQSCPYHYWHLMNHQLT